MHRLVSAVSLLAAYAVGQVPAGDSELLKYGSQFGQTALIVTGCFLLFRHWISTRIDLSKQSEAARIENERLKTNAEIATMQAESASRIRVAEGVVVQMQRLTDWLQQHEQKDVERQGNILAHITAENRRTQAAFRAMIQSVSGREVPPLDEERPRPAGIRHQRPTPVETPAFDPKRRPRGSGEGGPL